MRPPRHDDSVSAPARPIIVRSRFVDATALHLHAAGTGFGAPATAHPSPFSYIDVRLPGAAVELTVVAHILDVAHDLGIQDERLMLDPAALAARRQAIVALLGQRIQVWVDGRQASGPVWSAPQPLDDGRRSS